MKTSSDSIRAAAAAWVLATAILVAPGNAQERELFSGAALLYTVPRVTVVYPAGPGEDRERNRISAERRAAYLAGRHETEAFVVADVDISAEEKKQHLLVLGWNNLLLREIGLVGVGESGWSFQGLERGFGHDLLFSWISPYSAKHEFVFWSRIDPELDRYLVLPFFGSDWIVYDRYTVEQFGRFRSERLKWPPERNPDVEIDNRSMRPDLPAVRESEHYALYDRTFRLQDGEIEKILQARERAWRQAVSALGKAPQKAAKIKLYVYADSTAKEDFCDVHDARHHVPSSAELHLTKVIALDSNLHEDMHLIARQVYGPAYLTVLVEGLSVWAEQKQGQDDLPVYASMLADRVDLPGLAQLLDEETMRVLMRNRIGFPVAGLFVDWLLTEGGANAVARVYGQYASDPAEFAGRLGLTVEEIDTRFAAYVRRQAAKGRSETAFREATARALHYGGLGDYEQAVPALEEALRLRPDDLFTRYSLAVARMNLDESDAAEAELRKVLEIHSRNPGGDVALLAWYQLGELYLRRGDPAQAREAYLRVLQLPDFKGMHRRTRQQLAKIDQN